MGNTLKNNLKATLAELRLELEVTTNHARREDIQKLITRFEAVLTHANGVETLPNL